MNEILKQKADLAAENYMVLKKVYRLEDSLINYFGALIHAIKDTKVNIEQLGIIKEHIINETRWLPQFRESNLQVLSNLLCLQDDYKQVFTDIIDLYCKLGDAGFKYNSRLPICAYIIALTAPKDKWDHLIRRMTAFYERMKADYPLITSVDDYILAAILAASDMDVDKASEEINKCYDTLKNAGIKVGNCLQTLSQVLALGGESADLKCQRTIKIFNDLRFMKCNLNNNGLPLAGMLALVSSDTDKTIDETAWICSYLNQNGGYDYRSMDIHSRSVIGACLIVDRFMDQNEKELLSMVLCNCIITTVIEQKTAKITAASAKRVKERETWREQEAKKNADRGRQLWQGP